jgi:DNA modification methylase
MRGPSPKVLKQPVSRSARRSFGRSRASFSVAAITIGSTSLCFYAVRKGSTGHWQGARDQSTLWTIGATGDEDEATVHGTQKPVECMRRPVLNNSAKSDTVYEPFAGSGTTMIAAETVGRRCVAMEIDPRYCDVVVDRWQKFTGGTAVLDGEGLAFDEAKAARAA